MLDISPQLEQAIISQAQQQGVSVSALLAKVLQEDDELNSDLTHVKLTDKQAKFVMNLLDDDTPPTDELKRLLAVGG